MPRLRVRPGCLVRPRGELSKQSDCRLGELLPLGGDLVCNRGRSLSRMCEPQKKCKNPKGKPGWGTKRLALSSPWYPPQASQRQGCRHPLNPCDTGRNHPRVYTRSSGGSSGILSGTAGVFALLTDDGSSTGVIYGPATLSSNTGYTLSASGDLLGNHTNGKCMVVANGYSYVVKETFNVETI